MNPVGQWVPIIFLAHAATIRDNEVTSTSAPRPIGTLTNNYYGGGAIFAVNALIAMAGDAHIHRNIGDYFGGGILLVPAVNFPTEYSISVTENARISDNQAYNGGGVAVLKGVGSNQQVIKIDTYGSIDNNEATNSGGGVYADHVFIAMYGDSAITSNTSHDMGGGVTIIGPLVGGPSGLYMEGSATISDNTADSTAAGVLLSGARASLNGESTISRNIAQGDGGGVYLAYDYADTYAAGITINDDAEITFNVAGDGTAGTGGGIYSDNPLNTVTGNNIINNNPDNCTGSSSGDCIA